jgi:protein SCO1/2
LLGVCSIGQAGPTGGPQGEQQETPYNIGFDQKLGDKINLDLMFKDEEGNDVTLRQCIDGKPSILILAWYQCPGLCGEVLNGVLDAIRKMRLTCGKDFNIVTVSFDQKEPPGLALAKKRHFVTEYGRKEAHYGWKFLTGKQDSIDQLTASVGFRYEWDKMLKEFKHVSGIVILTPEGVISQYLPGIEYLDRGSDGQLLEDQTKTLRLSLVEASDGKVGDFADRIFLSCYRFDPHRSQYSLSVLWLVRAGGLLTLLIIAGIYARTSWKIPGGRLLVVGILTYAALLPLLMFTRISVGSWIDSFVELPRWTQRAIVIPVGIVIFLIGRWVWRSARKSEKALHESDTPSLVGGEVP